MARHAAVTGMVLAAGLGTRLRPLTELLPKPAVPVLGLPLLRYALARLAAAGVARAVVNAHHLAGTLERVAREAGAALGIEVAVSREPVIAGTGGALREARRWLAGADEVVVWNGDVLFDLDVGAALSAHRAGRALATMVLAPMPEGERYATVDVDATGRVRRIAGLGPGGPDLAALHFTGVHVLSAALLDRVPAEPFACDVNRHVYPPLLAGGGVAGWVARGYWNDLGTPARYLAACLDLLAGRAGAPPAGADPFAGMEERVPGAWVAPSAVVEEGARLEGPAWVGAGSRLEAGSRVGPGAVIGAGGRVAAGGAVRRAVTWEGTAVEPGERLEDAVAAGALRVPAGPVPLTPPAPAPAPR